MRILILGLGVIGALALAWHFAPVATGAAILAAHTAIFGAGK